jgi:8-oxo-dGTP diphosphatase
MTWRPNTPPLAADCVVFDAQGRLLLIKRGREPHKGLYALPGGFVEIGETVEAAALRELKEETGIEGRIVKLIGLYSDPARDPVRHTVAAAYLIEPITTDAAGGDDADAAEWVKDWRALRLAFDHSLIARDGAG